MPKSISYFCACVKLLKSPGISLWFAFITVGFAPVTTGGNWLTGPKSGSGKFANGFIISGIPSSVKGILDNWSLILNNTSAASSKGFSNPNLLALSAKAFITLSEILRGLKIPFVTVAYVVPPTLSIACSAILSSFISKTLAASISL